MYGDGTCPTVSRHKRLRCLTPYIDVKSSAKIQKIIKIYNDIIIIGEAKTIHDIENDHTEKQLKSYIDEVRCYKGDRHIVVCSNTSTFALIKNMIVRKKIKEHLDDITFHVLDNLSKVAVV